MLLPSAAAGSQHLSRHLFWNSSSRIGRRARGGGSVSLMAGYFFGLDSEIWRLPVCPASFHGMHETLLAYTVIGVNTHTDGISTRQIHWESSCAMCPRVTCCVESCEATGSHFCDHMVVGHKYQVFACSLWEGRIAPNSNLDSICTHFFCVFELGRSLISVTKSPL